ncbi:hypothetical protein CK620_05535 [Vandammella animalimorsus]|uniref:Uncharacterized protein n=1 Tax=Vandammella animalimorsus TaxID=2029117 RepID=A0A2A2A9X9_9BURK|nr:hypothetical protein CK620_05535 [Vandammella animalimorsus]
MAQAACKQPGQCTRHCRAGEENDAKQTQAAASRLPGWGQGAKTAPGRVYLAARIDGLRYVLQQKKFPKYS